MIAHNDVQDHDPAGRRRLLVADASRIDRALLRHLLAHEGLEILETAAGDAGLALARDERPDLVLLDLQLPDRDGFEIIRALKDDPATAAIPVIFVSVGASTAEKARGLDMGAVDFLAKPFEAVEVRARIRAALRTKSRQDLLERRAYLDGLTGLANRLALEERLHAAWAGCGRRGTPMAVLVADLDHFKGVNDRFGHAVGDEVLRHAARLLRDAVRASDFVARFGGEEFVVVAPDCDLSGAVALAERFRAAVAATPRTLADRTVSVTSSVGVAAAFDPTPFGPGDVLEAADQALYRAKASGRNAVWAWDRGRPRPTADGRLPAGPALIGWPSALRAAAPLTGGGTDI